MESFTRLVQLFEICCAMYCAHVCMYVCMYTYTHMHIYIYMTSRFIIIVVCEGENVCTNLCIRIYKQV
jgi:hypothetical protein